MTLAKKQYQKVQEAGVVMSTDAVEAENPYKLEDLKVP